MENLIACKFPLLCRPVTGIQPHFVNTNTITANQKHIGAHGNGCAKCERWIEILIDRNRLCSENVRVNCERRRWKLHTFTPFQLWHTKFTAFQMTFLIKLSKLLWKFPISMHNPCENLYDFNFICVDTSCNSFTYHTKHKFFLLLLPPKTVCCWMSHVCGIDKFVWHTCVN